MANNKKELTELLNAIGMTAEMALNFFRAILEAGGTTQEALVLTQAFMAASIYGKPKDTLLLALGGNMERLSL